MIKTEPKLMTASELAAFLQIPLKSVYALVQSRRISFHRIGGRGIRFDRDDVLAWLEQNRVPSLEKSR